MNKLIHYSIVILVPTSAHTAFGYNTKLTPPDSTTSIIDKTAAAYMIEEGKTLFGERKIKDALVKFREAGNKDENNWRAPYWAGLCHYKLHNYGYALKYAQKALSIGGDKVNDEIYYRLATAHHRLGSIDSALVYYVKANENMPKMRTKVLGVDHHIKECEFAKKALANGELYTRVALEGDVNSGYDDYNAIIRDGGKTLYFTSRRSNTKGGGMNPDDQTYFEDIYKATWNDELKEWDNITNDLGKLNTYGFDAINYISPDGLYGVSTMNSTAIDTKKMTRGSDLCELKMSNKGTWNSPKIIKNKSINSSYFDGAATLTADGNTMYFVSDRKGEKSSTDIYVVEKNGKSWGEAKPLPMTVNTKGRETTPFISPDGRFLFFSSDGHLGMGGLDIYVVENLGDSWGTPINLGNGINTVNNDTHFSYIEELNKAFLSSYNVVGNKASIDMYELDMTGFKIPTK